MLALHLLLVVLRISSSAVKTFKPTCSLNGENYNSWCYFSSSFLEETANKLSSIIFVVDDVFIKIVTLEELGYLGNFTRKLIEMCNVQFTKKKKEKKCSSTLRVEPFSNTQMCSRNATYGYFLQIQIYMIKAMIICPFRNIHN